MAFSFGVEIVNMRIRKKSKSVKLNVPDAGEAKEELIEK
jgi:hypothetical protein